MAKRLCIVPIAIASLAGASTWAQDAATVINADLYGPPAPNAPRLPTASTGARQLADNIRRLRLEVDRHVGIHGAVGTHDVFLRAAGSRQ